MGFFSRIIGRVASLILDLDDTQQPVEQIAALNDFLSRNRFEIDASNIAEFLQMLKKKHFVDAITISRSGELVAASENNGVGESFVSAALIEFITKQIAQPETVLMKMEGHWFMIFPFNQNIYLIKAGASLSTIELKALVREIELFFKNEKNVKSKKENGSLKKAF